MGLVKSSSRSVGGTASLNESGSKRDARLEELIKTARYFRRSPLALTGTAIMVIWIFVSLFAGVVAPYDPLSQDIVNRLQAPSAEHLMGTDQLGRDIMSRIIFGGRISLPIGFLVVSIATVIGTLLGAVAAYVGGFVDTALMRITDMVMGFPAIILAMAIAAALGSGLEKTTLALIVVWWPGYARLVRSLVLTVKSNDYVVAARALGCRESRILFRTVLPNCIAPAIVLSTMEIGRAILTFSGLSFLGLGAVPPTPEWGTMVAFGIQAFDQWWVSAFPGLAIMTAVMGFNFLGDGVRDVLDPRMRRRI